jgi:hypothetical protein
MSDEIPDGLDETPIHPKTVEGKIMEMRDLGAALVEITDELTAAVEKTADRTCFTCAVECPTRGQIPRLQTAFMLKLSTIVQLQTDTITQLYGELRNPQDSW